MQRQRKYVIIGIFSLILFSINLLYAQSKPIESKVYFNRAKFLNTEIHFNKFKPYKDCVGLVMFINISKKTLRIKEITHESESVQVKMKSQTIRRNKKGILTFLIKNPPPGEFKEVSYLFFEGISDPVPIHITGTFITQGSE